MNKKRVALIIRDGWGHREDPIDNAIKQANTPFTDHLMKTYPSSLLDASGKAVGLPDGYQGNSEVGHMTIGSGRIIYQAMMRINMDIESGEFFNNKSLVEAIQNAKKHNTKLHIIGLLQTQGVHAHINHLFAILDLCNKMEFKDVYVHAITDGRDAPVTESLIHIESLHKKFKEIGFGNIVTLSGRYYAMDRDKRWDRTKAAYDCIVEAKSENKFENIIEKVKECHSNDETDEFIKPRARQDYGGIKENDSIIFFNYRTDRTRQLTKAIVENDFDGWDTKPLNVLYVAMTQFYRPMNAKVAYEDIELMNLLGEVVSKGNLTQLRTSETEKYAHVTFFFNGQKEEPNPNEDRIMINSPKVATYDLKPEMSVYEIKDTLIQKINEDRYDLIITNLVNCDMVGHTGKVPAIIKGIESIDICLKAIVETGLHKDYTFIIFADHGNAEDQTPKWRTSHTINKVPVIIVSNDEKLKNITIKQGKGLKDISPTTLKLLGLKQPQEMTGEPLF